MGSHWNTGTWPDLAEPKTAETVSGRSHHSQAASVTFPELDVLPSQRPAAAETG